MWWKEIRPIFEHGLKSDLKGLITARLLSLVSNLKIRQRRFWSRVLKTLTNTKQSEEVAEKYEK